MNLVGPGPLAVHYEDCDRALRGFEPVGRWADLGTGAGFPGIPFAARFPGVQLELVDSRQKRCRFIEEVLAEAGRDDVVVKRTRHEALESGVYDGILSRALHAPEIMLDVARRLLVPGGSLVLFLQEDCPVPCSTDFELFHVEPYVVDGKRRKSVVLRYQT